MKKVVTMALIMPMNLQKFASQNGELIERAWLMHYIDTSFNGETATYERIGEDLEEYAVNLNPEVETKKNIWGENSTKVKGYQPQSEVGTYYAKKGDALFTKLMDIAMGRKTGDALKTTVVDVIVDSDGKQISAHKCTVTIIPQSYGGGTECVNVPYQIHYNGTPVSGTWKADTKTFTVGVGA